MRGTWRHATWTAWVPTVNSWQLPQNACDTGPEGPADYCSVLHAEQALKKTNHLEKSPELISDAWTKTRTSLVKTSWSSRVTHPCWMRSCPTPIHMSIPGSCDPWHIINSKGNFVGNQGPVIYSMVHLLLHGSSDKYINVWNAYSTYKCQKMLKDHNSIVLMPYNQGLKLYCSSADHTILTWDKQNLQKVNMIWAQTTEVHTGLLAQHTPQQLSEGHQSLGHGVHWAEVEEGAHWPQWLPLVTVRTSACLGGFWYLYSGFYETIKIWDIQTLHGSVSMSSRCQWQCLPCHHKESHCLGHLREIYPLVGYQVQVAGVDWWAMWAPCVPWLSSPFQTRPKSSAYPTVPRGLDYKQHDLYAAPAASPGPCDWAGHVPVPALHGAVDSTLKIWTCHQRIQAQPALEGTGWPHN